MEYNGVVNSIQELRPEMMRNDFHYRRLHPVVVLFARHLLDYIGTQV